MHEFPLLNWIACTDGDFKYINRDLKPRKNDIENWTNLHNKYLAKFGIGKQFQSYLDEKKQLIELRNAFVQSGDKMLLNDIRILEISIENQDRIFARNETTIESTVATLSKWLKMHLRITELTILEYKNYMIDYERSN